MVSGCRPPCVPSFLGVGCGLDVVDDAEEGAAERDAGAAESLCSDEVKIRRCRGEGEQDARGE